MVDRQVHGRHVKHNVRLNSTCDEVTMVDRQVHGRRLIDNFCVSHLNISQKSARQTEWSRGADNSGCLLDIWSSNSSQDSEIENNGCLLIQGLPALPRIERQKIMDVCQIYRPQTAPMIDRQQIMDVCQIYGPPTLSRIDRQKIMNVF